MCRAQNQTFWPLPQTPSPLRQSPAGRGGLQQHGELTNKLLRDGPLNVKRLSFVIALLERLPGVVPTKDGVRLPS